jgi:hypothetical protein
MHIAANVGVGIVAGLAWPFVYVMGYVVADLAGWTVGDPTLTDDGVGMPMGVGVIVVLFILVLFLALNVPIARRARIPAALWMPAAVAIMFITATVTTDTFYSR